MNRFLSAIIRYVKFYLLFLGLTYLLVEWWNWFPGDSLLENAAIGTLAIIQVDLARLVLNKWNSKKDNEDTKSV